MSERVTDKHCQWSDSGPIITTTCTERNPWYYNVIYRSKFKKYQWATQIPNEQPTGTTTMYFGDIEITLIQNDRYHLSWSSCIIKMPKVENHLDEPRSWCRQRCYVAPKVVLKLFLSPHNFFMTIKEGKASQWEEKPVPPAPLQLWRKTPDGQVNSGPMANPTFQQYSDCVSNQLLWVNHAY